MWKFKVTGNMTLSVIDQYQFQVIKVDILALGIMKAGNEGADLAKAINNLSIIASFPDIIEKNITPSDIVYNIPHPEVGFAPPPWSYSYNGPKKFLVIRDSQNKKIADRKFPMGMNLSQINVFLKIIAEGIDLFNERIRV